MIVAAFRKRLQDVAGFSFVPEPLPMKNKINAVVYCLLFASIEDILPDAGRNTVGIHPQITKFLWC